MTLQEVLELVGQAREDQEERRGVQNHAPLKFLAILSSSHGQLAQQVVEYLGAESHGGRAVRLARMQNELVQVAAVAVAMVEAIDRNKEAWS